MRWEIVDSKSKNIINTLLTNRGIKTKKDQETFLNPIDPLEIPLKDFGVEKESIAKIKSRLEEAKRKNEKIVIFGDYDADGVTATAILWEVMYREGFNVMPFIPDRFTEGYGLKEKSIKTLKEKFEGITLIITIDNGIVAYEGVKEALKEGIEVIVCDHHLKGEKKLGTDLVLHSTKICGSAIAWILAKEISSKKIGINEYLSLAAIGTIADQMVLLECNRSIVKFGLEELNKTNRVGLKALINNSGLTKVGVYEVGFILAPRINAMGRLSHALDSLRLLCTRDKKRSSALARALSETNSERQRIVDEVLTSALEQTSSLEDGIIMISGEYHEGVIGLASGKVTEKYNRPSIIFSLGKEISKASARSIAGFNIIERIKETGLILEGGGHPMAAGFSIENTKLEEFKVKINELSKKYLTTEILEKKLKVDLLLSFEEINNSLLKDLQKFEPTGYGNPSPLFATKDVEIVELKKVGFGGKHLKMKVKSGSKIFDAIAFGTAEKHDLSLGDKISLAYSLEENVWNGHLAIQLKVKDILVV